MATPLAGLHVVGTHFQTPDGRQVLLKGVSSWSLEFSNTGNGHFTPADYAAILSNGYNMVRIPTNSTYYLNDANYPGILDNAIKNAIAAGLYVVIVGQWAQHGNSPMAYPQDRTFWQQIAAKYGADPNIGYCPVTEPHDVSWSEWLNGWQGGPGMQELVNIIRAQSKGIIFVNGLSWGRDLTFLTNGNAPKDPLNNLAYEVHPYSQDRWEWHTLAGQYCIYSGELGIDGQGDNTDWQLRYFGDQLGNGYAVWAWTGSNNYQSNPANIADASGNNRSPLGQKLYAWNQSHPTFSMAGTPPPVVIPPVVTPPPVPGNTPGGPDGGNPPPSSIPPAVPGKWTLVDDAADLRKASGHSVNVGIDTTNLPFFGGDSARFVRTNSSTAAEWVTYHLANLSAIEAEVFFWPWETIGPFVVEASPDGKAWTAVTPTLSSFTGDWKHTTLHADLPVGTNDVRITWPAGGKPFDGQIGQVRLAATAPVPVPPPPPVVTVPTLADVLALAKAAGLIISQTTLGGETIVLLRAV